MNDKQISDLPLPFAPAKKPKPAEPRESATPAPHVNTGIGAFYAEHRALVDARRSHLGRVGMLPEHVTALAMPDLAEKPAAPPVHSESLPDVNMASDDYETPKLPKLLGVNVDPAEE